MKNRSLAALGSLRKTKGPASPLFVTKTNDAVTRHRLIRITPPPHVDGTAHRNISQEPNMPHLRFDLIEGRSEHELKNLLDAAHKSILAAFGVPERDRH